MKFRIMIFLLCAAFAMFAAEAAKPPEKTVVRSFGMKNKSDFFGWGGAQRYVRTRVSCGEGVGKVEILETQGDENRRYQMGALCGGCVPDPEISITDDCIGWEETEALIRQAHERLAKI